LLAFALHRIRQPRAVMAAAAARLALVFVPPDLVVDLLCCAVGPRLRVERVVAR
jgi:hypothetical protein